MGIGNDFCKFVVDLWQAVLAFSVNFAQT